MDITSGNIKKRRVWDKYEIKVETWDWTKNVTRTVDGWVSYRLMKRVKQVKKYRLDCWVEYAK